MKIRIGTRKSKLALIQTDIVIKALHEKFGNEVEPIIVHISTKGDEIQNIPLTEMGGKGLFSKTIHNALINDEIDIAVHSLKDLEATPTPGIQIACVLPREDAKDVLINRHQPIGSVEELPKNAIVGTCSPRRTKLLLNARPDLKVVSLRGNVPTRLEKLLRAEDGMDAIVMASAGLRRLELWDGHHLNISGLFGVEIPLDIMVPAAGQGIIAVECLSTNQNLYELLQAINDETTRQCYQAEQGVVIAIGGNCHTAIGAYCQKVGDNTFHLKTAYFHPELNKAVYLSETTMTDDLYLFGLHVGKNLVAGAGFEPTTFRL